MFPGMNPKLVKQAMKKMGIKQEEIEATEVIIKTNDKEIIITNPSVAKVDMAGQESFQISGEVEEKPLSAEPEINEEDIKTVMQQTNCSEEEAKKAISQAKGNLAEAIMNLKG